MKASLQELEMRITKTQVHVEKQEPGNSSNCKMRYIGYGKLWILALRPTDVQARRIAVYRFPGLNGRGAARGAELKSQRSR
nr:hypothetical protein CFP56_19658 [Quercus suber]